MIRLSNDLSIPFPIFRKGIWWPHQIVVSFFVIGLENIVNFISLSVFSIHFWLSAFALLSLVTNMGLTC
jgi:hypothetical protein